MLEGEVDPEEGRGLPDDHLGERLKRVSWRPCQRSWVAAVLRATCAYKHEDERKDINHLDGQQDRGDTGDVR